MITVHIQIIADNIFAKIANISAKFCEHVRYGRIFTSALGRYLLVSPTLSPISIEYGTLVGNITDICVNPRYKWMHCGHCKCRKWNTTTKVGKTAKVCFLPDDLNATVGKSSENISWTHMLVESEDNLISLAWQCFMFGDAIKKLKVLTLIKCFHISTEIRISEWLN